MITIKRNSTLHHLATLGTAEYCFHPDDRNPIKRLVRFAKHPMNEEWESSCEFFMGFLLGLIFFVIFVILVGSVSVGLLTIGMKIWYGGNINEFFEFVARYPDVWVRATAPFIILGLTIWGLAFVGGGIWALYRLIRLYQAGKRKLKEVSGILIPDVPVAKMFGTVGQLMSNFFNKICTSIRIVD